ncbi:hypothetical protein [Enhygromyxa salina]|uniref:Uncharacterized protein n=1 Tax=Enhygromyxa salina TaxID=215803 RepID=A0A2S9YWJ2_9BACT|nr:hypothetical protein [Enhygromyxa salina]PRQ09457.1 hypothetical protein ENSA7_08220 [Enhygromyxa salina]
MARCAKNHQFRADLDPDPERGVAPGSAGAPEAPAGDERRAERDRRARGDLDPARPYGGPERRQGPRRAAELPSSIWRQPLAIALAVGLGIAAGLVVDALTRQPSTEIAAGEATNAVQPPDHPDAEALAGVQALRDEAEALTAAQVELDETSHERWMPRVALIERALEDPDTHPLLRHELTATITALECVGVLAPTRAPSAGHLCHTRAVNPSTNSERPS